MAAQQLKVFVSHSHEDDTFCQKVVAALRGAGADVWYDEHNMGSGRLGPTIERELRARPVFVVILSPAALRSQWVEDETRWAYGLLRKDASRVIQPVTAATTPEDDIWLFLQDFKRIEQAGNAPYPVDEAANRLVRALGLTPRGAAPAPVAPQPTEDMDDLLTRGKALVAQKKYAEALPLLERASQLAPGSFDAWANLGFVRRNTGRTGEAVQAYDRAIALDDKQAWVWNNKGYALDELKRFEEALAAYDRALALDPNHALAWNNKGYALDALKRYEEALVAYDRALALDPNFAIAWNNKGLVLNDLQRYQEALAANDRALAIDPNDASTWTMRGTTLSGMKRYKESIAAYEKGNPWRNSSADDFDANDFQGLIRALRALGRTAEAEAAERRAKELGG